MFKGSSLMGLAGGFIAFSTVVILLEWYAIQGIGKEEDISREEAAVALAGVDVSPPTVNNSKEAKIDKKSASSWFWHQTTISLQSDIATLSRAP